MLDAQKLVRKAGRAYVRPSEGSGTTTLTTIDNPWQIFNLSAARTCVLPSTGVRSGDQIVIENRGSFLLTIQSSSAANTAVALASNVIVTALVDAPIAASDWDVIGNVEYLASSTGTWDAAAAAVNTLYGPDGAPITGSLASVRVKVCQAKIPVLPTDELSIEYKYASGNTWINSSASNAPITNMAGVAFGSLVTGVANTTDISVQFFAFVISGSVYNTNTGAATWGTAGTPTAWRVKKVSK